MSGGFARTAEWSAAEEAGRSHITGFRKAVSATATVTSAWLDYSYFPGAPAANFYASSPLEAALVDVSRGIPVPTVAPSRQSIRNLKLMSGAAAATIRATGALAAAIVVTGDALTSANVGAAVWSAPTAANDIAGTMGEKLNDAGSAGNPWATVIESGLTAEQVLRIIAAAVAGESSGAPDGPIEFTGLDGSTVRLSGDVDADGNRSNVTVDGA